VASYLPLGSKLQWQAQGAPVMSDVQFFVLTGLLRGPRRMVGDLGIFWPNGSCDAKKDRVPRQKFNDGTVSELDFVKARRDI